MNIIAMTKQGSKQADSMMKVTASVGQSNAGKVSPELAMGGVRRLGGQVFRTEAGYEVRGCSSMPTKAFVDLLKKDNGNVINVNYKPELEGNSQISETEEPLWSIDKQNGNFQIKRNF